MSAHSRYDYVAGTAKGSYDGVSLTTFPCNYTVGNVDVFVNGEILVPNTNFFATDGANITLSANLGDNIHILVDENIGLSDYITKSELDSALVLKQDSLVSSTNIKTINGDSILGSGNLVVGSADSVSPGSLIFRATADIPSGYLLADGSVVSQSTYPSLFSAIGHSHDVTKKFNSAKPFQELHNADVPTAALGVFTGSAFPSANANGKILVTKGYVYYFGGYPQYNQVWRAPIVSGTVGTWVAQADLPCILYGGDVLMFNSRVYLFPTGSYSIYTATIDSNGVIGTFVPAVATQKDFKYYFTCFATKGYVYRCGGESSNQLLRATVDPANDFLLSDFKEATALPEAAHNKDLVVIGNYVYFIGSNTIYKAVIDKNGLVGDFSVHSATPASSMYAPRAFVTKNTLYIFHTSTTYYYAPIDINGEVGSFISASLGFQFGSGSVFATSSKLYLAGGNGTTMYSCEFSGGSDDYTNSSLINIPISSTNFTLPDYSGAKIGATDAYVMIKI